MKSLRTSRQEGKPAVPTHEPVHPSRASSASGLAGSPSGEPRREPRMSLPGSSAGWRLPSGQLLVEYALQTCFTGSPFERSPFQGDSEKTETPVPSLAAEVAAGEDRVSQGIHRLRAAVDREAVPVAAAAPKRSAAARALASSAKPVTGKERSRS